MRKLACAVALVPAVLLAQSEKPRVEPNVIFGMYSGLALLMDVYHPAKPNGYGVIFISGSGWHSSQELNAEPLKDGSQSRLYAPRLTQAGYTVFSITHRAAPRFRYPAAVEDAQRAVRFVRENAQRFGIRADRIGAVGGSSGGHLVEMLGVLDGKGDPGALDPVNRQSAKVQCVVARAAPSDMARMVKVEGATAVVSFLGMPPGSERDPKSVEARKYWEASPVNHVTPDDAPILMMHGDADATVPIEQSQLMEQALKKAGVPASLLRIPGGAHGPTFAGAKNPPDYMGAMIQWLDRHLRQ
jgi:acetyl esterase/lipase